MSISLAEASPVSLLILGAVVAAAGLAIGAFSNAILREAGFGTVGNGIVLAVGAGSGAWAGLAFFGKL